jgi:hypothetical protein
MEIRTIFLNACNEICNKLEGFKAFQKGQKLKKYSSDKDILFEIFFQSSFRNDNSQIQILPFISINSVELKKWNINQTKNKNSNGIIYNNQLGYITPYNTWKDWNLAFQYEKSIKEITDNIIQFVFPIFEIFNSKENAIEFLKNHGSKFNTYTKNSLEPINFLICFAKKDIAETYFNNYINECSYKGKILKLYDKLKNQEIIDLNYSEFVYANKVKIAYVNGLKIYSR